MTADGLSVATLERVASGGWFDLAPEHIAAPVTHVIRRAAPSRAFSRHTRPATRKTDPWWDNLGAWALATRITSVDSGTCGDGRRACP